MNMQINVNSIYGKKMRLVQNKLYKFPKKLYVQQHLYNSKYKIFIKEFK